MRTKEILQMSWKDINKMSRNALSKVVSQVASAANKRIRRAREEKVSSRSIRKAQREGKFSVAGKSTNELRKELARAKEFMTDPRSSVAGVKRDDQKILERVREMTGEELSKTNMKKLFKVYDKLREEDPYAGYKGISSQVIKDMSSMIQDNKRITQADLLERSRERLSAMYEENERLNEEFDIGTGSFF